MAVIKLENIDLEYSVYGSSSRSFKTSFLKAATGGYVKSDDKILKVQALREISFELKDGDRLGLIGHNGAGKSSLLKLIAQIYEPSKGKLNVVGETNCLFDVMVGLDHSLTGIENIKLRGLIFGLPMKEIEKSLPEIIEFTGLGHFIKMPLRTYSAGMLLRLGFSIVTHFKSQILLIDEVVNVGDAQFIEKAKKKMKELIHQTQIVVISTHDHHLLQEFCNKIICLDSGRITFFGDTKSYFMKGVKK